MLTGKGIGSPVCATRRLPLVRPDQNERVRTRTLLKIASICKDYGKPRPTFDANVSTAPIEYGPVGMGMPIPGAPTEIAKISNCLSCVHYVGPTKVASETTWNAGICRAKGTLLTPDRLRAYAQACKVSVPRQAGMSESGMMGFMLNPEYSRTFGEVDHAELARKVRSIEPGDWPTEKPVTDADRKEGIKSWRKIVDPKGIGADIYVPVFDIETFDEDERALVPRTGGDGNPELYRDHDGLVYKLVVLLVGMKVVPAVWGAPGLGKTELGRHLAWLMQAPFARISITGQSEVDDIFGKMTYVQGTGTVFQPGRLPKRWIRRGVCVLDEPNVGPPEIWQGIRPMTDNSKQLVIDASDDPTPWPRHPWALLMLAMNQAHDVRNIGTNTLADADTRRLMHVLVTQPPREVEKDIIRDHCKAVYDFSIDEDLLNRLMNVAEDIRPQCDKGTLPLTWGTAVNIKIASLFKYFGALDAFDTAVLSYLDPRVASAVMKSIKTAFPTL